uniref:RNA-directed RNA polymerase n=1 Tax=Soybean thrips chu-like virus 1 TaxID=2805442 RepID=A0A7T8JIE7_9VIRU|nr:RNA-dependent RNA polymerase [Soybean thrips chu-like virus 1]
MFASQTKHLYETPHSLVFERKLDTALRASTVLSFQDRIRTSTTTLDDKLLLSGLDEAYIQDLPISSTAYSDILLSILDDTVDRVSFTTLDDAKRVMRTSDARDKILRIQMGLLLEHYDLPNRNTILSGLSLTSSKARDNELVRNLLEIIRRMNQLIEYSNKIHAVSKKDKNDAELLAAQSKVNSYSDRDRLFHCQWSSRLVYIKTRNKSYIYPRQYLLLIHNKLADLVSVLILTRHLSGNIYPPTAYNKTLEFIRECIRLHHQWDNQYFVIAKNLESLVIAESLIEVEEWVNDDFLRVISNDLKTDPGFKYMQSKLRKILKSVPITFRHELGCLSKILGHPLVDMRRGAEAIQRKTNEEFTIDPFLVQDCINNVKENYIRNHILMYQKWPPAAITSSFCHEGLKQAFLKNLDPRSRKITEKYGVVPVDSYIHIDIEKNMHFDQIENALPLLKDKTITVLRNRVIRSYICKGGSSDSSDRITWKDTRLLLYYLTHCQREIDHLPFLKAYQKHKSFEHLMDYLVLRIVPKEKELKEIFRGFGCQTYLNRLRALIQEKNAMKYLDLFSNEQAMTLDELSLLKKLYAWRTITKAYKNHQVAYINIDSSSWNNKFRKETVDVVMKETLDKVFGTNIFGRTQECYENMLFYVPDEDDVYFWEGQAGGIEGLNQDTWVIVYIAQIKVALKGLGYKCHILCKGDDLRVAILIPPTALVNRTVKDIKEEAIIAISNVALQFGHVIKINDSYGSNTYFNFGKLASIGTIELGQALRKIMKTYGANNAFLPTLDEYIGAAFSNAHSAAKVLPGGISPYIVALEWALWYLSIHETYKQCTSDELVALMLVPSMLGGFPIIYLPNYFVRAESDLLAPFLSIYHYCTLYHGNIATLLTRFMRTLVNPRDRNLVMLCKDPYSIPIDRPTLPATKLRTELSLALKQMTINESIKEIYAAIESRCGQRILEVLETCNVYNSKVLNIIYSCLPEGVLAELLRMFESARSVHEALVLRYGARSAKRTLRRVIASESTLQTWRFARLRHKQKGSSVSFVHLVTDCPAQSAQLIRQYGWGKPVEGITNPPFWHLMKITTPILTNDPVWDTENHFEISYTHPKTFLPRVEDNINWASSHREPFIGQVTSRATVAPTVYFIEKDPLLAKIKNLLEVMSWTNTQHAQPDGTLLVSNFNEVIASVLHMYTDRPTDDLSMFAGTRKQGSIQHHLSSQGYRQSIVPNSLTNWYQLFEGRSSSHFRLRGSAGHFLVNFLAIYAYSINVLMLQASFDTMFHIPDLVWLVTRRCIPCVQPIVETPIIVDTTNIPNKRAWSVIKTRVAKMALRKLIESIQEYQSKDFKPIDLNLMVPDEFAVYAVLQEFLYSCTLTRDRLVNMVTQHHVDPDGMKVLLAMVPHFKCHGFDSHEIPYISMATLFTVVSRYIYGDLLFRYPRINYLDLVSLLTYHPAQEFSWYYLMSQLFKSGRLQDFIEEVASHTDLPQGISGINIVAATTYVALVSFRILSKVNQFISIPFIYLSYYTIVTGAPRFMKTYSGNMRAYLMTMGKDLMDQVDVLTTGFQHNIQESVRMAHELMRAIYIIFTQDLNNLKIFEDYLNAQEIIANHVVECITFDPARLDIIEELDDMRDACGYTIFKTRFPHPYWEHVEDPDLGPGYDDGARLTYGRLIADFTMDICSTTLAECVETMRHLTLHATSRRGSMDLDALPRVQSDLDQVRLTPVTFHIQGRTRIIGLVDVPARDTEGIIPPDVSFEDHAVILDSSDIHRVYGDATQSMNRITDVFFVLGIPPKRYHKLAAIIYGDGLGGSSSAFCSTFPNSYISIATLTEVEGQHPVPPLTAKMAEKYSCRIDTDSVVRLRSDANIVGNLQWQEERRQLFHIVCSDIEPRTYEVQDPCLYLFNITQFYLRNRYDSGLLILQIRLNNLSVIIRLVALLHPYCSHIMLYKPETTTRHSTAFLVAWGSRSVYVKAYGDSREFISSAIIDICTSFRDIQHRRFQEERQPNTIQLRLSQLDYRRILSWIDRLPYYLDVTMVRRYNIPFVTKEYYKAIGSFVNLKTCLSAMYPEMIRNHMEVSLLSLRRQRHIQINPVFDATTLTHAVVIFETYLSYSGFLDAYNHFALSPLDTYISDSLVRDWYLHRLEQCPRRIRYNPDITLHYRYNDTNEDGLRTNFFPKYMQGIKSGILYVSTTAVVWHHLHNAIRIEEFEDSPDSQHGEA